jgi:hypothetical protein
MWPSLAMLKIPIMLKAFLWSIELCVSRLASNVFSQWQVTSLLMSSLVVGLLSCVSRQTVIQKRKRNSKQIIIILTNHRNHQSSPKTIQWLEVNQITKTQHSSNTCCTIWWWNLGTKGTEQIQNHSRDKIFVKNCKYTLFNHKNN